MKNCLWIVSLLIVAGCASNSVHDSGDELQTTGNGDQIEVPDAPANTPAAASSKSSETAEKPNSLPPKKDVSTSYAALSQAVRSGNEDAIYQQAVALLGQNPNDVKALNALGLYHYRKNRFLAARYFFSRGLQASPKSGELHNNQGLVSLALDEQRDAIRSFKKALELNSSDPIAAANLGSIYIVEKDYGKALPLLEIAIRTNQKDARLVTNYGVALAANGKYDQAKKAYEEALKISSTHQEAMFNLAVLQIEQMKQYSDGLDHLQRLKFLGPNPEIRNRMNALENKAKAGIK